MSAAKQKIIAMYARGTSVRDIQALLEDQYRIEVSPGFISGVTDALQAWASITGDAVLAGRNDVSRADLRAISDDRIIGRLEATMGDARAHLAALAAAGLSAALLDDVDDLIDDAEQAIGKQRAAIGDRSAAVTVLEGTAPRADEDRDGAARPADAAILRRAGCAGISTSCIWPRG